MFSRITRGSVESNAATSDADPRPLPRHRTMCGKDAVQIVAVQGAVINDQHPHVMKQRQPVGQLLAGLCPPAVRRQIPPERFVTTDRK